MSKISRQELAVANRLIRINNAGEKGFNVAAENVKNRGLKLILKSFAQERAEFAEQLRRLVQTVEGEPAEGSSWLAALHRGWINIKAAVTIGQPSTESVILAEVTRGERAARQAYQQAMEAQLRLQVANLVQQQYQHLQSTKEQIRQLRGYDGNRTVVRLFDSEEDAQTATAALTEAGFPEENIERVEMSDVVVAYSAQEEGNTMAESAFAGAVFGAALGVFIGLVAIVSAWLAPGMTPFGTTVLQTELVILVSALGAGLILGGLIGAIIGVGIVQDDIYRYSDSMNRGLLLLLVRVPEADANEASNIMQAVNTRRWPVPSSA